MKIWKIKNIAWALKKLNLFWTLTSIIYWINLAATGIFMLNSIKTTTIFLLLLFCFLVFVFVFFLFFNQSKIDRPRERGRECVYAINCLVEFVVPLIAGDKVTRRCPQTTTFEERRSSGTAAESRRGPSAYQPNALPLFPNNSRLIVYYITYCAP